MAESASSSSAEAQSSESPTSGPTPTSTWATLTRSPSQYITSSSDAFLHSTVSITAAPYFSTLRPEPRLCLQYTGDRRGTSALYSGYFDINGFVASPPASTSKASCNPNINSCYCRFSSGGYDDDGGNLALFISACDWIELCGSTRCSAMSKNGGYAMSECRAGGAAYRSYCATAMSVITAQSDKTYTAPLPTQTPQGNDMGITPGFVKFLYVGIPLIALFSILACCACCFGCCRTKRKAKRAAKAAAAAAAAGAAAPSTTTVTTEAPLVLAMPRECPSRSESPPPPYSPAESMPSETVPNGMTYAPPYSAPSPHDERRDGPGV